MSTSDEIWRAEVNHRLAQGTNLEFSLAQFAGDVGALADDPHLLAFMEKLVQSDAARKIVAYRCPVCERVLSPDGAPYSTCPHCKTDYLKENLEVQTENFYRLEGELSRDIRWMIVIHGMNSRATWQEEFSLEISNRLSYSAPVLIYKYGWATIDVLVSWLHRRLAKQLGVRVRIAIEHAVASGRPSRPDVIAHSFGTHLFSMILEDKDFEDLTFGRVITAGSIVRPDYNWAQQIESGRIEAVLNHVARKDKAVPAAQFAIPGTGPGGKVGYLAERALNVGNVSFGHSDFFVPDNLRQLIAQDGLWHNFFTRPLMHFEPEGTFKLEGNWNPAPLVIRGLARSIGYFIFTIVAPISWLRRRLDP